MVTRRIILILLVFLLSLISAFGQTNFADVTFTIDETGESHIVSITNVADYDISSSSNFTSKTKRLWLFNVSDQRIYEKLYFEVILPKDAQIQYMKSSSPARIVVVDGHPAVRGVAENVTFEILVQYEIIPVEKSSTLWLSVISLVLISVGVSLFFRPKLRKENRSGTQKSEPLVPETQLSDATHALVERQAQIVALLEKGKMTQIQLAKELDIPKSSIFRQIRSLEQKGIVEKEHVGMSTIISLKKK